MSREIVTADYTTGDKSLIEMINSLFTMVNLYDPNNIKKIRRAIIDDLGNENQNYSVADCEFLKTIIDSLELWLISLEEINGEPIDSFSTSVVIPYKPEYFLPIFQIVSNFIKKDKIDTEKVLNNKTYIGTIYRSVINKDINIFAFLVQPAIYKMAVMLEDPNEFTLDKIENVISTFMKREFFSRFGLKW